MKRNPALRKKIFERDNFTCQKCGFQDFSCKELEAHHIKMKINEGDEDIINLITLCSICHHYAPDSEEEFKIYLSEKIDEKILETFRKSKRSISYRSKKGMQKRVEEGKHITKAPFGYKLVNKQLLIDEGQTDKIKGIFEEYLNTPISLTQLAKKNGFTTSGIIKLLQNTTYIGKVKFANKETDEHKPMIEKELFDKVQEKLR